MLRLAQGVILVALAILSVMAAIVSIAIVWAVLYQHPLFDGFWYVFGLTIAEPLGLLYLWSKNALGLREQVGKRMTFNTHGEINNYMKQLIRKGSAVDIVSRNLSWVQGDQSVEDVIVEHSKISTLSIFVPGENAIVKKLRERGVPLHVVQALAGGPRARFTLLNKDRPGSGILAVGWGDPPSFTVLEFHESGYPQIIALARDYVNSLSV